MLAALTATVARVVGVHTHKWGDDADRVRSYWRDQTEPKLPELPPLDNAMLGSMCMGLGDTLMLTDVPKASKGLRPVFSNSRYFRPLMAYNPWWTEPHHDDQLLMVNAPTVVRHYASGNGHYLQRLRRALGYRVEIVPRPCVTWKGRRANNRVVMHFEAGQHALWQRKNIQPRARTLYPETRKAIEDFVHDNPQMEFWCVGAVPDMRPLKGVQTIRTPEVTDLVDRVGRCGWFLGIVSGVMHLATAMQLKCVVLVDFPEAHRIVLPTLKHTDQVESEWLYPMNVHLHQNGEASLVRRATTDNIKRAFNGELYPYHNTEWCGLIEDKL